MTCAIMWFRRDLRLSDNTALNAALQSGLAVLPLFIFDKRLYQSERTSANRMRFLLDGLAALDQALRARGSRLLLRHGEPAAALRELVIETGATAVYFNRDTSPYARQRDEAVLGAGFRVLASDDDLLMHAPGSVMTADGRPYTVFTPFKKAWLSLPKAGPYTTAGTFHAPEGVASAPLPTLAELGLSGAIALPEAGEAAALRRLERFVSGGLAAYHEVRDRLYAHPWLDAAQGTSGLSPYLRMGMLSIRQAYAAATSLPGPLSINGEETRALPSIPFAEPRGRNGAEMWISELVWREFYHHILYHFPHVLTRSFRPAYDDVAWRNDADELARWQAGQTGYPVVDAAMRQLAQTGWMHNRARMIAASFLTKDLLHDWREGELYFMRHLLDGDPAANNGGWQWTAGSGTDAQPYFRIFNPVTQGQKFDPDGAYVRAFVPELRDVPTALIHAPWTMAVPPAGYPPPMVERGFARERALGAFERVRGRRF